MASIQHLPPDMTLGYCAMCGDAFRFAKALSRPPRTCGMWKCMVKAGETGTVR